MKAIPCIINEYATGFILDEQNHPRIVTRHNSTNSNGQIGLSLLWR